MPICIECHYPVPQLYHTSASSKAAGPPAAAAGSSVGAAAATAAASSPTTGTPSQPLQPPTSPAATTPATASHTPSGHAPPHARPRRRSSGARPGGEAARRAPAGADVRLTQCPRCKRFADKYVEHDFVVLFIDLVLVKPQVYRHLLFNRLGSEKDAFDPAITRLGTLLLLFDVYLTWSSIEALPPALTASSAIPRLPILAQYAFYLVLCAAATLAQHVTVRLLARLLPPPPPLPMAASTTMTAGTPRPRPPSHRSTPNLAAAASPSVPPALHTPTATTPTATTAPAGPVTRPVMPGPNAISTALFVSSCMQLFPILMVVWKYDDAGGQLARGVSWAVGVQNVEALRILLGARYAPAAALVAAGALARWLAKRVVLGAVGLGGAV